MVCESAVDQASDAVRIPRIPEDSRNIGERRVCHSAAWEGIRPQIDTAPGHEDLIGVRASSLARSEGVTKVRDEGEKDASRRVRAASMESFSLDATRCRGARLCAGVVSSILVQSLANFGQECFGHLPRNICATAFAPSLVTSPQAA
jgi:hypothetical protein